MKEEALKKITTALVDTFESEAAVLENLRAVKGKDYTRFVLAIADMVVIVNKTNQLICKEVPQHIVELVVNQQNLHIQDLMNAHFQKGENKDHHAACDECFSSALQIVKARQALNEKLVSIAKLFKKSGDSNND